MRRLSKSNQLLVKQKLSTFLANGICSPETAYFMGAFVTDGSCTPLIKSQPNGTRQNIRWNQKLRDYQWLNQISHLACDRDVVVPTAIICSRLTYGDRRSYPSSALILSDRGLCEHVAQISQLRKDQVKSSELSFPEIPTEYIPHFLRGVMDGDGCVGLSQSGAIEISFSSGSKGFLEQIRNNLQTHCLSKTELISPRLTFDQKCYSLRITRNQAIKELIRYLYCDLSNDQTHHLRLSRKYTRMLLVQSLVDSPKKDRIPSILEHWKKEQMSERNIHEQFVNDAKQLALEHGTKKSLDSVNIPHIYYTPSFLKYAHSL